MGLPKLQPHRIKLHRGKDKGFISSYGGMVRAECLCGWEGSWRSRPERAQREGDAHLAEAEAEHGRNLE